MRILHADPSSEALQAFVSGIISQWNMYVLPGTLVKFVGQQTSGCLSALPASNTNNAFFERMFTAAAFLKLAAVQFYRMVVE